MKRYLPLLLLSLLSTGIYAQSITATVSSSTYCDGSSVSVGYFSPFTLNSGNILYAQLSDENGLFTSPDTIGTLTTTSTSGTISGTIPNGTAFGTSYRIRVVATNPAITGTDNGSNLIINNPAASFGATTSLCNGSTVTLTVGSGGSSYSWNTGSNSNSIQVSSTGTYTCTVSNGVCTATYTTVVNNSPPPIFALPDTTAGCGDTVEINAGAGYNSYSWDNGNTSQIGFYTQSGYAYCTVTGSNGCSTIDSTYALLLTTDIQQPDTAICSGESITLDVSSAGCNFAITSMSSSGSAGVDHNSYTGDDRGGIAVTSQYIYYTGDSWTVRYNASNLTNPTSLSRRDGIFSDLSTGQLYTFWTTNFNNFVNSTSYTNNINAIRQMDVNLNYGTTINLSQAISAGSGSGVFAGPGYVILWADNNNTFYKIDLSDGQVTTLGTYNLTTLLYPSENWASWGIAECSGNSHSIVFRRNGLQQMTRLDLNTNSFSTVASFSNLSDMACITYSQWNNRWYWHHEGSSQFGSGSERLGYASATATGPSGTGGSGNLTWNTGATTGTITVTPNTTTTYIATSTLGSNSCSDTVVVTVNPLPIFFLTDTVNSTCDNDSVTLNAGGGYNSYLWSNGATTQTTTVGSSGYYTCTVTNNLGCERSDSTYANIFNPFIDQNDTTICDGDGLTLTVEGAGCNFQMLSFGSTGSSVVSSSAGDDRGGIAVTDQYIYYTGDSYTVRYNASNLTGVTQLSVRDGIFSDLSSGQLYSLWSTTYNTFSSSSTYTSNINAIRLMDANLNYGTTINLSQTINAGSGSGVFAGPGYVIIWSNAVNTFYKIDLGSGQVTNLGSYNLTTMYGTENWASWGIAECTGTDHSVVFRYSSGQSIRRLNIATGVQTTVSSFSNLSDMACITYSPWNNRWYFNHESSSQFGFNSENIGYADATANGPTGSGSGSAASILWNTNATTSSINVSPTTTTTYTVQATSGSLTCHDTVVITVTPNPIFSLTDTVNSTCTGTSVTLNAGAGYAGYLWSTGATTQTATVSTTGWYTCTVNDTFGCTTLDSTYANIFNPYIVQNDTAICAGDAITLETDGSGCLFNILSFSSSGSSVVSASSYTSDDRGSMAITPTYIYYTGDAGTVRYLAANLGSPVGLTQRDGIFSDLDNGQLYTFWSTSYNGFTASSSTPLNSINAIRLMDNSLNLGTTINLSQTISAGSGSGVFAGPGYVILWANNTDTFYKIELSSGQVTNLGTYNLGSTLYSSESWAHYGVAECSGNTNSVIYRYSSGQTFRRYDIGTGSITTMSSFSNLSDIAAFTYSPWHNRWYWYSEGGTQFSSSGEQLGYATASANGPSGSGGSTAWNTGTTGSSITVSPNTTTSYIATMTQGSLVCTDTVVVTVNPVPLFTLTDTVNSLCDVDSVTLNAGAGYTSYSWSTGETSQTISADASGFYNCTVSNTFGCTTSDTTLVNIFNPYIDQGDTTICDGESVTLTALDNTCDFAITSLGTTGSALTSVNSWSGDDRGAMAISSNYVYYTGDSWTVRANASNLGSLTTYTRRDGLFSDLATGQLYTFWSTSYGGFINTSSAYNSINAIRQLDANLNDGNIITLSQTISAGSGSGVFAGPGYVIIWANNNDTFYKIDLSSGQVTNLGSYNLGSWLYSSENWAAWGVAECDGSNHSVLFRYNSAQTIRRYSIASGLNTTFASFSNLNDMAIFTYSRWNNRWYWYMEGSGQFGSGSELLGYASATANGPTGSGTSSLPASYVWNTNATTQSITVTPNTSTTYTVQATSGSLTCSDTTVVTVTPNPIFQLTDTVNSTCTSPNVTLNAGAGYSGYLWSTGATTQTISVNTSGNYTCTVNDSLGCTTIDTTYVNVFNPSILQNDTAICAGDTINLPTQGTGCNFQMTSFSSSSSSVVVSSAGDDRGAIAVTPNYVYYTGDSWTVRYTLSGTSIGSAFTMSRRDGIFSDLDDGQLYTLYSSAYGGFASSSTAYNNISAIQRLNSTGGVLSTINLSQTISAGYGSGMFAGPGYLVLWANNNNTFYRIDLSDGTVTTLGTFDLTSSMYNSENWANWGIAECSGSSFNVVFRYSSGQSIRRHNISSGVQSTVSSFSNLGDIAVITYSKWLDRWFWHSELGTQFSGSSERTGSCAASSTYSGGGTGSNVVWNTGATTSDISVSPNTTTSYIATMTSGSLVCTDTVVVTVNPVPIFQLTDTVNSTCTVDSVILNAGPGYTSYLWSTGETTQSISTTASGQYSATVSNNVGCTTSDTSYVNIYNPFIDQGDTTICFGESVTLSVQDNSCTFGLTSLSSTGSALTSVISQVGDDRGGIAVTPTYVYYTGDNFTVRALASNLSSVTSYTRRDGIFSDLASGQLYTFWSTSYGGFINTSSAYNSINAIRQLDPNLNNGNIITLSQTISAGSGSGVFAGPGYVILWANNNNTFYKIDLSSGQVTNLGVYNMTGWLYGTENWAAWGVAECNGNDHSVVFRYNSGQTFRRYDIGSGQNTNFANFSNLNDMACFTYSPWNNRWYWYMESSGQFGSGSELLGYANATANGPSGSGSAPLPGTYSWNTNATTQSITVTPNTTTTYIATMTSGSAVCSDTMTVTVNPNPIFAMVDTVNSTCDADSVTLNAGAGYAGYTWSSGETTQTIVANTSGWYSCTVNDSNGCTTSDSTYVNIFNPYIVQNDTAICSGESITLETAETGCGFSITSLTSSSATTTSAGSYSGDDRGAIAVTPNYIYYTGDSWTVRYTISGSSMFSPTTYSRRDGLFSDLDNGQLYTLWSNSYGGFANSSTAYNAITGIRQLTTSLGDGTLINLSQTISAGSGSAIFAGPGYVIIWANNNDTFYKIDLATGQVTTLGTYNFTNLRYGTENWASWGIAECNGSGYNVVFRNVGNQNISRFDIANSSVSTVNSFSNLGDIGVITYSQWNNRWYWYSELGTQFSGSSERLGSCLATANVGGSSGLGNVAWNTGATTGNITVTPNTSTTYIATMTSGSAVCSDTVVVTVNPNPIFSMVDTVNSTCTVDSVTLNAGAGYAGYTWSSGETTQTIVANSSGWYTCTVNDSNLCTTSDSSYVNIFNPAIVQNDTAICAGESITLETEGTGCNFQMTSFTSSSAGTINAGSWSGDDRGGIAVTPNYIYYTGDSWTVRYSVSGSTFLSPTTYSRQDGIFSDLESGQLWTFWSNNYGGFASSSTAYNNITGIRQLNTSLGTGTLINLSQTISAGYGSGVFAGPGYVILWANNSNTFYKIDLSNGQVTNLGVYNLSSSMYNSENWANWGIAECSGNNHSVVFRYASGQSIRRHDIATSVQSTVNSFSNLGDAATITYSQWHNRWFWYSELGTQFSSSSETLGSATASATNISTGSGVANVAWNTGSTTETITVTPNTTTTYIATMSSGSAVCSDTVTVTVNPTVTATVSASTDPTCSGATDGTITVTNTGGNTPYTYLWSTGDTTLNLIGLGGGTYTLTVTTADGCSDTAQVTLTDPAALSFTPTTVSSTCPESGDGTASAGVSGGTMPYTYAWSTGGSGSSITGLNQGVYKVTVADANSCVDSTTITVNTSSTVPSVTPVTANVITVCQGNSATLTANNGGSGGSGGSGTFSQQTSVQSTFSSGGNQSHTFTGIITPATGNGTLTVYYRGDFASSSEYLNIYGNGSSVYLGQAQGGQDCSSTYHQTSFTITASQINSWGSGGSMSFLADATSQVDVCSPIWQGYMVLSYPYDNHETYWFADSCTQTIGSAIDSGASITVTPNQTTIYYASNYDGSCWSVCDSIIISVNPLPVLTVNPPVAYLCNNSSVTLQASGAVTYFWSPANGLSSVIAPTVTAAPTSTTTYTLFGVGPNNCQNTTQVTVNSGNGITANLTTYDVSCNGGSDGAAVVTPQNGVAPYTYTWPTGVNAISDSAYGLAAGTYTVTVSSASGSCNGPVTLTITEPDTLSASAVTVVQPSCNANSGSLTASINGGTSPYTYNWSNSQTGDTISNLAAGTYSVTITDANGCTANTSTNLLSAGQVQVTTASVTQESCPGNGDASITLSTTSGTIPYTYSWSSGANTAAISNLSPGTYTVTVTDASGCTDTTSAVIVLNSFAVTVNTDSDVSCNGLTDGAVSATISGGSSPYTYLWNNAATTATQTGLAAGTYSVTVTDANACSATGSTTVSEPLPITVLTNVLNQISCNGANDGSASVTASGGTGAYTYAWSNSATTATVTGLAPGTYTVTVSDNNSCTATGSVTITQPSALVISIPTPAPICSGGNVGSALANVTGGTSPYTYLWSTGSTTNAITNVGGGTYTVTVTDATGCSDTASAVIVSNPVVVSATTTSNVSCNGLTDGAVSTSLTGGVAPFTYTWNVAGSTSSLSGLGAGSYFVTVTDGNGCSSASSAVVTEPSAIALSTLVNNQVTCNGDADGNATVTASGGTSPYTYAWTGGGMAATATNLTAGTNTVTVTDANGCSNTTTVTITEPTALVASLAGSGPICSGSSGTVTPSVTGGSSPYTYNWSNGSTSSILTNVAGGTYSLTITDANGCTDTATANIVQSPAINVSFSNVLNNACFGGSNGAAFSFASGGTAPLTYLWSTGATTTFITGLTAGTYTVTVTDTYGCTQANSTPITEPSSGVTISATNAGVLDCFGDTDGFYVVSASNGTAPYTYSWSNSGTGDSIGGLGAGTYTVTATDGSGCSATATYTLTEPAQLSWTTAISNAPCSNGNGSLAITVSGGTSPYTYLWDDLSAQTTANPTGLVPGPYSVTVTDANGCSATGTDTVGFDFAAPTPNLGPDQALCGTSTSLDAGAGYVLYQWSNGGTTQTVNITSSGTYTVTVTNAGGCQATDTVVVTLYPLVSLSTSATNEDCNLSNGTATATATGGTTPFTYNWSNGGTTAGLTGLATGTFTVTVTDANGCSAVDSATVNVTSPLVISGSAINENCGGAMDGSISVSTTGGGGAPYTYAWSNGATTSSLTGLGAGTYVVTVTGSNTCFDTASFTVNSNFPAPVVNLGGTQGVCGTNITLDAGAGFVLYLWSTGATTQSINVTNSGTYSVTVTNSGGCQGSDTTQVTFFPAVAVSASATDEDCNLANGTATATGSAGGTPYSYTWSNGDTAGTATGLAAGTYTVTLTDANGCTAVDSATVGVSAPLVISGSATDATCNAGADGTISVSATGGGGAPYTYAWSNSGTTANLTGLTAGTYTVTVTGSNSCTDTASFTVGEPAPIAITTASTNEICGQINGTAGVTVSGGTSPYTYAWTGGATTANLTALVAGTYSITVTDANGCTNSDTVVVGATAGPSLAMSAVPVTCFGGSDGSATVTASAGTAPYTYSWNDNNSQTTATASNLMDDTYTVTVTDANGCSAIDSVTVTTANSLPTVSLGPDTATCDTFVILDPGSGFTAYSWSSGGSSQTELVTVAGTYTVTVTDGNGCTNTDTINVTLYPGVTLTTSSVDANCGNADGEVSVTVSTGTTPYTYNWTGGGTTATVTGLVAGTYSVTVTDANGCSTVDSAVVNDLPGPSLTAAITDVACNGDTSGSIDVTPTAGGGAPYTYAWSNGASTNIASGLSAGTYTVTVTGSNGCTTTDTYTVNEPAALTSSTASTDEVCGQANGSTTVTAAGGTTPYTYLWSDPNASTTATANNLAAGTYYVTVTDSLGCTTTDSATVGAVGGPSLTLSDVPVTCLGGSDGEATATATGGTTPYTYLWDDPSTQTTATATGLIPGTYSVTVTDNNGCSTVGSVTILTANGLPLVNLGDDTTFCGSSLTLNAGPGFSTYAWTGGSSQSTLTVTSTGLYSVTVTDVNGCTNVDSIDVTIFSGVTANIQTTDAACGNSDGQALAQPNGGSAPYTYNWNTGGTSAAVTGLAAGVYTVTVSDANGCSTVETASISNSGAPTFSVTTTDASCFGTADGTASVNPTGGTPPYFILWSTSQSGTSVSGLAAGTYSVIITDASNCQATATFSITQPTAIITSVQTTAPNCGQSNGSALVSVTGGVGPYTYLWNDPGATTTPDLNGVPSGAYTVIVTDATGCQTAALAALNDVGAPVAAIASVTDATCLTGSNGSATATATGGIQPYTYVWDDPSSQTTATATGLAPGLYNVLVSDSLGCGSVATATVSNQFPNPIVFIGNDTIICEGSSRVLDAGSSFASYIWSTGDFSQTTTVTAGGTYAVTVTDFNNCQGTDEITLTEENCVGIGELPSTFAVNLYPNPTNGRVFMDFEGFANTEVTLTIFDLQGARVAEEQYQIATGRQVQTLDMPQEAQGVYLFRFLSNDGVYFKKVSVK